MATFVNSKESVVVAVETVEDRACRDFYPVLHFNNGGKCFPRDMSFRSPEACDRYLARGDFKGKAVSDFDSGWHYCAAPEAS